jgi:sulfur-oxidizing protein SoxZ
MGDPMKIRAKMDGDVAEVRVLMGHAMETGQRKGSDGKIIPAHFIKDIRAELNGKVVFEAAISQAISRNPLFAFKVKGAKVGDKITIHWEDNTGDKRTDTVTVSG